MTPRQRVLTALEKGQPDRVPYVELEIDERLVMNLFGTGYTSETAINPAYNERSIEAEIALSEMIGRDNVCFPLRAPVLCDILMGKDGRKFFGEGKIGTRKDLSLLRSLPDPKDPAVVERAKRFVDKKGDFAACGVARLGIAPAMLSMGIESFSINLYDDPDFVMEVFNFYAEWTADIIHIVRDVGFDFFFCSDDVAFKTGPFFSPAIYREMILPRLKDVSAVIPAPWIYHSDGNLLPIIEDWLSLGQAGMHPIEPGAMDIFEMKKKYGRRICLVGNIEIDTLSMGTEEDVRREVREKFSVLAPGGGYIASSSNSLTNYCRPENVLAMRNAIQEFGEYPVSPGPGINKTKA
jgi:uroporphyrinogen-III decarboxylase